MNESNDLMDSLLREHAKMKRGTAHDVEFIEELEERIDLDERGNVIPLATRKEVKTSQKRIYGLGLGIAACMAFTFLGYKQWGPQYGNIVLSNDASAEQLKDGAEHLSPRVTSPMRRAPKSDNSFAMKLDSENPGPEMMSADNVEASGLSAAKSKMQSRSLDNKRVKSSVAEMTRENKFVSSFNKKTRLSRFALNVQNASYPLIKHLINEDRIVPAEVVRLEELVNAFEYNYPKPSGKHPVAISLDAVDCPWNLNHKLVRVAIQAKSMPRNPSAIATDAEVQVEFNPEKVKRYRLIGYDKPSINHKNKTKRAVQNETIQSGHTVTALYEIELGKANEAESMNSLRYEKKDDSKTGFTSVPVEFASEYMFVKLAYKKSAESQRSYLSASLTDLKPWGNADADFKFSSAVALFGMDLRKSEFKAMGSLEMVEKLALEGKGEDKNGQREKFIKLVKKLKDRK